ncbi:hypothetical protein VCRA2122O12_300043 [Vibrio crassostreae]|nr:hypothetical protein VCRA2117O328_60164 [Vibrio crassostreae]CAK2141753.1 hypothetical protein VCRA2110O4_70010 [Vibrio crassostreae]CAK2163292.1 hypothetical protein VCRA2110O1_70167 [Vibrio crassostreae]CAK2193889.1 hypothetical protein VCRA2114E5_90168 [Vibrio crassostreae]CAK2304122.1 hypothetical protein VCRA2110O318_230027 [Vibrio crassostreae]
MWTDLTLNYIKCVITECVGTESIKALQAGTVSMALPFAFILLLICLSAYVPKLITRFTNRKLID